MRRGWSKIRVSYREGFGDYSSVTIDGRPVVVEGYEQFSFAVTISLETKDLPVSKQRYVITERSTGCCIIPVRCKTIKEAIQSAKDALDDKGGPVKLGQAIANVLVGPGRRVHGGKP